MRKDFFILLGLVDGKPALLDVFEEKPDAEEIQRHREASGPVSLYQMALRSTVGVEEPLL